MEVKDIKGRTSSGFKYLLKGEALNNFELLDRFNKLDKNPLVLIDILDLLLGQAQKEALYDHVRAKDGTVPTDRVEAELMEIFTSNEMTKN